MKKNNRIIIYVVGVIICVLVIIGLIVGINKLREKKKIDKVNEELAEIFKNDVITPEDDVYSKQKETDVKVKEAMDDKKYTLENPYVLENPYYISPLTALIIFQTDSEKTVTIEINGQKQEYEKSKKHAIPVYGLVAGKKNSVKISAGNKSKTLELDMINVKDNLNLTVNIGKGVNLNNGIYLISTPLDTGLFGFNSNGEMVYKLEGNYNLTIQTLNNGHFLVANEDYLYGVSRTGLLELDYLGKIYNVYDLEGGYGGDVALLDDEHILAISSKNTRNSNDDIIVEVNLNDGKIVNEWDLKNIVNNISNRFVEKINQINWASIESVYYDKASNQIILSLNGRNSVVSIDYTSKKINWIFGDIKYWNSDFSSLIVKYDGAYPLVSNAVTLNKDGNVVLFNNGMDGSIFGDSACSENLGKHSSGQIYKISNMTATLVNEFNDNNSFYSYAVSNYSELDNGNYLLFSAWQFGEGTMLKEGCTMNSNVENLNSTIYELDKNNNIIFKANFSGGSYRAYKKDFYSNSNKNFNVSEFKYYNTSSLDIYKEIINEDIVDKLKTAEKGVYSVNISKNLLSISAGFLNDDEVYVLLVGKNNKAYKYLIKTKGNYLQPVINLRSLSGEYALFLVVNEDYYNLDKTYKF